jgi:hypothetical protein
VDHARSTSTDNGNGLRAVPELAPRLTELRLGARSARMRARAPRYVATALLVVFVALGVRTLLAGGAPPPPRLAASAAGDRAAEDFALQFARAYLAYDVGHPGRREQALAAFVPADLDPDAGFSPSSGSQSVRWAQVASNQTALAGGRVITVAAQLSDRDQPVYLAVTVRHDPAGLALVGYPAFVGAPTVELHDAGPERGSVDDPAVTQMADRVVRNYLGGQAANLDADLTPDAVVTLPTVQLSVQSIDQVLLAGADARSGAVLVTASAADESGATYTLTYELGIAYPDASQRPYVDFVQVIPTQN